MTQLPIQRPLAYVIAAFLSIPVVIYMAQNCWSSALKLWKTGWESRPLIYIGVSGILVYVLYVAVAATGLAWAWKVTKDRFIGCCAIFLGLMLALYWLGFLTWSIGVPPHG